MNTHCSHCFDGVDSSKFPYYGYINSQSEILDTTQANTDFPDNFEPESENSAFGLWTHCNNCKSGIYLRECN